MSEITFQNIEEIKSNGFLTVEMAQELKKQNYMAAAAECRIRGIPEAKNIWMKERMLEAVAPSTTQTYYLNRTCSR